MSTPTDLTESEILEKGLDNLAAWIRTSAYPSPEINRTFSLLQNGDLRNIVFNVPSLNLSEKELSLFNKLNAPDWKNPLFEEIFKAKCWFSSLGGTLEVSNVPEGGSKFEIKFKANELKEEIREVDRRLFHLDHPFEALARKFGLFQK